MASAGKCCGKLFVLSMSMFAQFSFANQEELDLEKIESGMRKISMISERENMYDPQKKKDTAIPPPQKECALNSRVEIGANYTYVSLQPHGHQTFGGSLGGLQASYEYLPLNCFYGGVLFAFRDGNAHSEAGRRSLLYFDIQERLGYTFATTGKSWLFTLFSGFAYRYFGETFKPKGGDSLSFGYNEFYFPVGFMIDYKTNSWFFFGVNFTWMPQVYSTVSIVPLKGARWDITNRLDNFLVEIPLTFALTKSGKLFLIFKPTYQHWEDGHSTARLRHGIALGLPGNTYNFYGADLNFVYRF